MKVTRKNEPECMVPPMHYDMKSLKLQGTDSFSLGLSHFLPGGGAEFGIPPVNIVYYVLEGEITVKTQEETVVLKAGDSVHINVGEGRSVENTSNAVASMLVITDFPKKQ